MNFSLADSLADCPIIAAAKNDEGLEQALSSDSPVVFLLYGSVCSVAGQTRRVAAAGKVPFVHADLIDGLSSREVAVTYRRSNRRRRHHLHQARPHSPGAGAGALRRSAVFRPRLHRAGESEAPAGKHPAG